MPHKRNEVKSVSSLSDFNPKGNGSFISDNEAGINHRKTDFGGSDEVEARTYSGGHITDHGDDLTED